MSCSLFESTDLGVSPLLSRTVWQPVQFLYRRLGVTKGWRPGKYTVPANLSILSISLCQKYFCDVTSHIWNVTCQEPRKKKVLEIKYPKLCDIIDPFSEYFDGDATCAEWPENYFANHRYVQNARNHFEIVLHSLNNSTFWKSSKLIVIVYQKLTSWNVISHF